MTSSEISDAMGGAVTFRDAATIELTDPALVGEEESTRVQFAMKSGLLKAVAVFHHLPDMGTFSALTSTLTYGVHVTDLTEKFGEPESRIDEEGNKVTRWNRGPLGGAVVSLVDGADGRQALSIVYTAPDVTP